MVPLDEGIRDCGVWITTSVPAEVHLGLGTWCKRNEGTRFCGNLCTKSKGLKLRKGPKTWCKGNGGIRFCGSLCTRSEGLELRKGPRTWCKGNGGTSFCGSLCTKSEAAERRTTETRRRKSSARHASGPDSLFFRNERSRCTKCTAASSIYYAFFGAASSKAKPTPSGSAPQAWQRPRRPAAPRRPGSASPSPAKPSPHRRSLLIGASCAYIGRRGMCTVKVVPLPGMLST